MTHPGQSVAERIAAALDDPKVAAAREGLAEAERAYAVVGELVVAAQRSHEEAARRVSARRGALNGALTKYEAER
jgi:hypothetical protein